MTLAKAKSKANKTFIVQSSLRITYNCQNVFIGQASVYCPKYYKECLNKSVCPWLSFTT